MVRMSFKLSSPSSPLLAKPTVRSQSFLEYITLQPIIYPSHLYIHLDELGCVFSQGFSFLLLNSTGEDYFCGLSFPDSELGSKIVVELFSRVYVTVEKGFEPRHVGSFKNQNEQFTFQRAPNLGIIKHCIHIFDVFVWISSSVQLSYFEGFQRDPGTQLSTIHLESGFLIRS